MQLLRISAISVSGAMNNGFNLLPNALASARKYYEEALELESAAHTCRKQRSGYEN